MTCVILTLPYQIRVTSEARNSLQLNPGAILLDHGVSTISQSHPAQSEPSSKSSISKLFSISVNLCRSLSESIIRAAPPSAMAPDKGLVCPLDAIKTFLTAHLTRFTIWVNHFFLFSWPASLLLFQRLYFIPFSFVSSRTVTLLCRDESFLTAENWDLLHSQQVTLLRLYYLSSDARQSRFFL